MALSNAQRKQQRKKHKHCYVCKALNLSNSTFTGYEEKDIQFDHWLAQSLVGDNQKDLVANQLPVHAAKNGDDYRSEHYKKSKHRNCHVGKSNKFTGHEWVEFVSIYRKSSETDYSDDLFPTRKSSDSGLKVTIDWDEKNDVAKFAGNEYPIMEQLLGDGNSWISFSTVVMPNLLWVDREVQSRPADKKRTAELAWHLRSKPLLSPILCRYADTKLFVFDGNHRLCAFIIARENHPVPVTIFKGPEPKVFLEVVAEAHDKLTQKKYQYTDKAIKYSAISDEEIELAQKHYGPAASEVNAWTGLAKSDVKVRLIGRVVTCFEEMKKNWRSEWKKLGVSDASFKWMIEYYSRTEAVKEPFDSKQYLRVQEIDNLVTLFTMFDEELLRQFSKHPKARASLKTKWWKLAHKRFRTQLSQVVKHSSTLPNTPEKPAYAPEWNAHVKSELRKAVAKWRTSPVWAGNTAANNEPDVEKALQDHGFTESYLFS